jgi:hypothetical protein
VLLFNRGRVMTLPQGVSKATGLHVALDTLRMSARNTVAIGDAENDHAMLQLAEIGAAVEWGSTALKEAADVTVPGTGPKRLPVRRRLARAGRLPAAPRPRRRLRLGYAEDSLEFSLAVRGRNVLIAGDAKSGKSWIAGLLCEQLILHRLHASSIRGTTGRSRRCPCNGARWREPAPTSRELLRGLRYQTAAWSSTSPTFHRTRRIDYIRFRSSGAERDASGGGPPDSWMRRTISSTMGTRDSCSTSFTPTATRSSYCASRLPAELIARRM